MNVEEFVLSGVFQLPEFRIALSKCSQSIEVRKSIPVGRVYDVCASGSDLLFTIRTRLFETAVSIRLQFEDGILTDIYIFPILGPQDWPENMEKLRETARENERWFFDKTSISLPASFPWGEVSMEIYLQNCETPIVVRYK